MTLPPPGSRTPWAGRAVQNARAWVAAQVDWPTPCARCGRPVHPLHWHLGHKLDRQEHPDMTWVTSNWQVEHPRCSTSAGATQGNRRRGQRRALRPGEVEVKEARTCKGCGKQFMNRWRNQAYCSPKCRDANRRMPSLWRVTWRCRVCGVMQERISRSATLQATDACPDHVADVVRQLNRDKYREVNGPRKDGRGRPPLHADIELLEHDARVEAVTNAEKRYTTRKW